MMFRGYGYGSKTAGFGFGSEPAVFRWFFMVIHGFEPPVFCGSGLVSRFSDAFSQFRFGTVRNRLFRHGFGLKFFEPEPNHGSKIDGFSSDKFSWFRSETIIGGYGFGFNR